MENNNSWYGAISRNIKLYFIDPETDCRSTMSDLELPVPADRKLAFLYLDTSIASVQALLTMYRSNWAITLLNPALRPAQKEQLENGYKPALIYDADRNVVDGYTQKRWGEMHTCFYRISPEEHAIHPRLKLMLTTSGSTGSPKLVKLSEENIWQNAQSICAYLPIKENDTVPLNLPLYYAYGLSVLHANLLHGGGILCSTNDIMQSLFWEHFSFYNCTSLAGVPYLYEVLDRIGFTGKKYPALRYLTQAGGKMPESLLDKWISYSTAQGVPLYVMYGQTEATARMSYLEPEFLENKKGSIGRAIPGGRFSIDTDTEELLYYGSNVFGGYASKPEDLSNFDEPEYLSTGDLAYADDDGFYYITGRIKRIIKLFGTRINLDEIEQLLQANWPQNRFLCTGYKDKILSVFYTGEIINATQQVCHYLRAQLGIHPRMLHLEAIIEIPLNANGKTDYMALSKKSYHAV